MATTKKQALELIKKLPEKATWDEIMYEIYVRKKIAEGIKDADEGRVIPHEEVKKPTFRSERAEAEFWSTHDSTEYVDYSKGKRALFPNLKPSTETISLRLSKSLLHHVKTLANKQDVPYQTLLKVFLAERVQEEFGEGTAKASR